MTDSRYRNATARRKAPHRVNKTCIPCRERKVKCDAAVTGLPCSSCTNRHCFEDCVLPTRKSRASKTTLRQGQAIWPTGTANAIQTANYDEISSTSSTQAYSGGELYEPSPDLQYLDILHEAQKETPLASHHHSTSTSVSGPRLLGATPTKSGYRTKLDHLDEVDRNFLVKKGVFDLPPPHLLDQFVKSYFEHVHPFVPVLDRGDFVRDYQAGNCSVFLLRVLLTLAVLHVSMNTLEDCGFDNRAEAQESHFSKAKLLHDMHVESDTLSMLQGYIILCNVVLQRPNDRDYGYWFHNAIRLATKLDVHNICIGEPGKVAKSYRKVWWALYSLDIFYVFADIRRFRLIPEALVIGARTEEETGYDVAATEFLSPITPQQRASPVAHSELSRIVANCLQTVKGHLQHDLCTIFEPLHAWRKSLASKMHIDDLGTDVYYLHALALSHRYECILCRTLQRQLNKTEHSDWSQQFRKQLHSSMLELDLISMRVLATGTLQQFPASFITTMAALLAMHIETALNQQETDLTRSKARISISQVLLLLAQGRDIPVLVRALPIFDYILVKHKLHIFPDLSAKTILGRSELLEGGISEADTLLHSQVMSEEPYEHSPLLDVDFLGFNFLEDWDQGPPEFPF